MAEVGTMSHAYTVGDQVLLVDRKRRRYLITLQVGGEFHCHTGVVAHDDLIGRGDGDTVKSNRGGVFDTFRPTLAEFILKMPRGAQVIYPKDLGPILMLADIYPGVRVLESGVGSGALSMVLLRAGASVTGYEIREDFAARALSNVETMLGSESLRNYEVKIRDAYQGIEETDFDRVVLDLPEPWRVVPHAAKSLRSGGIILGYTPSITQASQFRDVLDRQGFGFAETTEVFHRGWHIDGLAVRPEHRMVAHTGFVSHARLLGS